MTGGSSQTRWGSRPLLSRLRTWASRFAVTWLFLLGIVFSGGSPAAQPGSELPPEIVEDETHAHGTVLAHAARRSSSRRSGGSSSRVSETLRPPQELAPRSVRPRAQRTWHRPRRTVPPDDDDDESVA